MARKESLERAAKLTGGFVTAKKNITIQYKGKDYAQQLVLEKIREAVIRQGTDENEIKTIDIYIKPEETKAFYVINGTITGSVQI